jgi:hypothetical protein
MERRWDCHGVALPFWKRFSSLQQLLEAKHHIDANNKDDIDDKYKQSCNDRVRE